MTRLLLTMLTLICLCSQNRLHAQSRKHLTLKSLDKREAVCLDRVYARSTEGLLRAYNQELKFLDSLKNRKEENCIRADADFKFILEYPVFTSPDFPNLNLPDKNIPEINTFPDIRRVLVYLNEVAQSVGKFKDSVHKFQTEMNKKDISYRGEVSKYNLHFKDYARNELNKQLQMSCEIRNKNIQILTTQQRNHLETARLKAAVALRPNLLQRVFSKNYKTTYRNLWFNNIPSKPDSPISPVLNAKLVESDNPPQD